MNQKQFSQKMSAYRFKRFANKAYSVFNSMHRVVNIGVVTGCVLCVASQKQAMAQDLIDNISPQTLKEQELDEVMVTTSAMEILGEREVRVVTVISKQEIEQSPAQSIQELLDYVAGVDVVQRGGHGVQADISIRGGSFDQTAIFLNGINLSNPQTGHYSLDLPINLKDIERVEIIQGPSSVMYGAGAFSGGINIITQKEPDHKLYGKLETGTHKLFTSEIGSNLSIGNSINQFSFGYHTSGGYIRNSDYDILNLLWQTRFKLNNIHKIDVLLGYNDKQYGANTFYSPIYPNQYDKTKSYLGSIQGRFGSALVFMPEVYWNRHYDCFQLFRNGTDSVPSWYTGHNYHRTDVYGGNFKFRYSSSLGKTNLIASIRQESIYSNVLGMNRKEANSKYTKSDHRTNISYTLEHSVTVDRASFIFSFLTNYNSSLDNKYSFYPNVSLAYHLTEALKVYASWNMAMRMPTFTDLYYTTKTHIGNIDLSSEKSESVEFGLHYKTPSFKSYLVAYLMYGKDIIDWIKEDPDDRWESRNLTKINKQGLEIGVELNLERLFPALHSKSKLNISYIRLHQTKDANQLISNYALNYLRDKLVVRLDLPIYKTFSSNFQFKWKKRMGSYLYYEDLKPADERTYPAFSLLDIELKWLLKSFVVNMSINNVLNKKYFDIGNIPQSGFLMIGGITYTL